MSIVALKVADGYIYGRGAVDMKSGLCASIMAMKFLKELGYDPKGSILSTCVVDEENGGYAGTKYLVQEGLISGDFGIDPEPTRCKMLTQHCGVIRAKITYRSESGHTSMPHTSITSLEKAVKAVGKLQRRKSDLQKRRRLRRVGHYPGRGRPYAELRPGKRCGRIHP